MFVDTFGGLDVVVNALDNVNARLYVDSRCVPASSLESARRTKCNTQMVVPNVTQNYGARDPPEKSAPRYAAIFCTTSTTA